jgi:CBS domain-containing protein
VRAAKENAMPISDFCQSEVVCCEPDTSLAEVAALMRKHHVGDVVVVDNLAARMPLGILTDRDIVIETMALGIDATAFTAGDLMSAPVVTVGAGQGLVETLHLMRKHGLRRMPVLGVDGAVGGILTIDDLVHMLALEMSLLADVIGGQSAREGLLRR